MCQGFLAFILVFFSEFVFPRLVFDETLGAVISSTYATFFKSFCHFTKSAHFDTTFSVIVQMRDTKNRHTVDTFGFLRVDFFRTQFAFQIGYMNVTVRNAIIGLGFVPGVPLPHAVRQNFVCNHIGIGVFCFDRFARYQFRDMHFTFQ
jgi:hypothetical protein